MLISWVVHGALRPGSPIHSQQQQYNHVVYTTQAGKGPLPCGHCFSANGTRKPCVSNRRCIIITCPLLCCSCLPQLRDLVPSAGAVRGPDGSDMKRPKHVVLSDTITLLKALRDKVG